MTRLLSIAIALASVSVLPAWAAPMNHDAHAGHGTMQASAEGSFVDGVVKKVDKAGGKVTLSHGPLTHLNMPAMTMIFRVKERSWLDRMQTGDKIRFVAEPIDGSLTIVKFETTK